MHGEASAWCVIACGAQHRLRHLHAPPLPLRALGFSNQGAPMKVLRRTMLRRRCCRVRVGIPSCSSTARPAPGASTSRVACTGHTRHRPTLPPHTSLRKHGRSQDRRQGELVQRRQGLRCVPAPCRAASPPNADRGRALCGRALGGAGARNSASHPRATCPGSRGSAAGVRGMCGGSLWRSESGRPAAARPCELYSPVAPPNQARVIDMTRLRQHPRVA